jgi:hypothetical protein
MRSPFLSEPFVKPKKVEQVMRKATRSEKSSPPVEHSARWDDFVVRIPKAFHGNPLSLLLDSHPTRSDPSPRGGRAGGGESLTLTGKLGV